MVKLADCKLKRVCKPNLQTLDFSGGAEGDRTPGLMTASHALSQLSYSPDAMTHLK